MCLRSGYDVSQGAGQRQHGSVHEPDPFGILEVWLLVWASLCQYSPQESPALLHSLLAVSIARGVQRPVRLLLTHSMQLQNKTVAF